MSDSTRPRDKQEARTTTIVLGWLAPFAPASALSAVPLLPEFNQAYLTVGFGLKDTVVAVFIVSIGGIAVAADNGLIDELQFMLGGFVVLFLLA